MSSQYESFDIVIDSPPPYGFRLVQKLMDNSLVVSKLRQGGKAGEAGLREGDVLLAVNSRPCGGFNCSQALNLIDSASQPLVLTVKRKAGIHPRPTNQPVIIRDTNFLPKKKPPPISSIEFKPQPSPEPAPEPPKTFPLVQEKPPSSEPRKIFVGSTYQEPKEEEKPQKVEFGIKSSIVVEPPSEFYSPKKTYTDSAFFNDPSHRYPTLEEQVQLARKVAMSVLAPVNANSKGHKMFMRAKERAWKYTTGRGSDEEETSADVTDSLHIMPKKIAFVPKLPEESTHDRMDAMSNEELELMRLQGRKTTHTNVAPQVCFSLADDLKNMKGKGGKLFAKRQAKSESWTVGGGGEEENEAEQMEENEEEKEREHKKVMDKLSSKHQLDKALQGGNDDDSSTSMGYGAPPSNKLDSMIKTNKAAMTPWQAAAEYGNVERAFEHLEKIDSQLNNNLQRQQRSNLRPNSWNPVQQPKSNEDFLRNSQARSPGYLPAKFPVNSSIEPPAGIPISDA